VHNNLDLALLTNDQVIGNEIVLIQNFFKAALNHAQSISGIPIAQAFIDKGYKKHGVTKVEVWMSGQKGLSPSQYKALKKRSAIEPHIGHMKQEGELGRNYLKGKIGDALQALLVAVGHNLRLILNYLRKFFALITLFIFYFRLGAMSEGMGLVSFKPLLQS
jgi:hypothetical protein